MTHLPPAPAVAPGIAYDGYDPEQEAVRESLLGLGNGVLFARAAAPELAVSRQFGPGAAYPGLYLAGCYDSPPRRVNGEETAFAALARLPDPFGLGLSVDGASWFNAGTAELLEYRHALHIDTGLARRDILFRDREGRRFRLAETRLVSMARPEIAALRWVVEPLDGPAVLGFRSVMALDAANEKIRRNQAYEGSHWRSAQGRTLPPETVAVGVESLDGRSRVALASRTRTRGGAAEDPQDARGTVPGLDFQVRTRIGEPVTVEKTVAVFAGEGETLSSLEARAAEALRRAPDFAGLEEEHRQAWKGLWRRVRIRTRDRSVDRAARFHAFHLLQTVSPLSCLQDTGFPARGWQEAYYGQVFWDELFAFPFYDLRFPDIARNLLLYRHRRLDAARRAAREAGEQGAMYPWRSARDGGEETPPWQCNPVSGRWMEDNTRLQRHIGAAVAFNLWQHHLATGDEELLHGTTGDMLVEIARFWAGRARWDAAAGRYGIGGVIGPDEYHTAYPGAGRPGLDNNAYTNVMAAWTLERGAELLAGMPAAPREALCRRLGLREEEPREWEQIARRLKVPFTADGIIAQFDGFPGLKPAAGAEARRFGDARIDWSLEARGDTANAYQITKQADVIMLFHLLGHRTLEDLLRRMGYDPGPDWAKATLDHYLARITHESSLCRPVCAGALAASDPEASWRFFRQAMAVDLDPDKNGSTHEGLHLGAMAGTLDVLQRHYLGLRPEREGLRLDPCPPSGLERAAMSCHYRGQDFWLILAGDRLTLASPRRNRREVRVTLGEEAFLLEPGRTLGMRCR